MSLFYLLIFNNKKCPNILLNKDTKIIRLNIFNHLSDTLVIQHLCIFNKCTYYSRHYEITNELYQDLPKTWASDANAAGFYAFDLSTVAVRGFFSSNACLKIKILF